MFHSNFSNSQSPLFCCLIWYLPFPFPTFLFLSLSSLPCSILVPVGAAFPHCGALSLKAALVGKPVLRIYMGLGM
jgi:hypothetical protein